MEHRKRIKYIALAFAVLASGSYAATSMSFDGEWRLDYFPQPDDGAVRVMPPCMAMGQAAGTAASLCIKAGSTPRALDASKLVATLRAQKAFLG